MLQGDVYGSQVDEGGFVMVNFMCQVDSATGGQIFGPTLFWVCLQECL